MPVASLDPSGPTHVIVRLHRPSFAYTVQEQFVGHLERLCSEWPQWYREFQPERFQRVRELVAMMGWVEQQITPTSHKAPKGKRGAKGRTGRKPSPEISKRNRRAVRMFKAGDSVDQVCSRLGISAVLARKIKSKARLATGDAGDEVER